MLLSVLILLNVINGLGTGDIWRRHLQWPAVQAMCGRRELACANAVNMTRVCTVRRFNRKTEYRDFMNPCLLFLSNMCDQPGEEFFIAWDSSCASYRRTIRNDNFEGIAHNSGSVVNNSDSKSTDLFKNILNISSPQTQLNISKRGVNSSDKYINLSLENVSYKDSINNSDKSNNHTEKNVNDSKDKVTNYRTKVNNSDNNVNDSEGDINSTETNEYEVNNTDNSSDSSVENSNTTEDTNTEDTNNEGNDVAIEGSGDSDGSNNALRDGSNPVTPKYETDTSFDDMPCRYFCPDVYSPMCLIANKKHMKYMKVFSFANYCLATIYFCKYPKQFDPPPEGEYDDDDGYLDVRSSPISMSFCGASRYLQFSRFSQAASAMGHYGWLNGDYRYSHILEPHERKPGYG